MCEGWGGGLQESLKRGEEGLGDVVVKGLSVEGLRGGQIKNVSDEFPLREFGGIESKMVERTRVLCKLGV